MPTVSLMALNGDGSPSEEKDLEIKGQIGMNLWELFEENGHTLNHGCLNGACSACRVQVLKGAEHLSAPGVREKETLLRFIESHEMRFGKGSLNGTVIRLSCQAKIEKDEEIILAPLD